MTDPPEWRLTVNAHERARICINAALRRAEGWSYGDIARELGLDSLLTAKKCAEVGFSLGSTGGGEPRPAAPRPGGPHPPESGHASAPVA